MCALAAAAPSCNAFTIGSNAFDAAGSCACQNARNKIQFNGVGGLQTYILAHRPTNWGQNMKMHDQDKGPAVIPPIVTLIVAVVGTAGILLNDFGPGNASQGSSNPG